MNTPNTEAFGTPQSFATYVGIAGGNFVVKVTEDTPGAKKREYTDKKNVTHTKWELVFPNITGYIEDISFEDTDFGEQIKIKMSFNDKYYIISTSSDGKYGTDFMKRFPSADTTKMMTLAPFDFEGDKGGKITGMNIIQNNEKIQNYYYDVANKKTINGLPAPSKTQDEINSLDKDEKSLFWKSHFLSVKKFLKSKVLEIGIAKHAAIPSETQPKNTEEQVPDNPENGDLPF